MPIQPPPPPPVAPPWSDAPTGPDPIDERAANGRRARPAWLVDDTAGPLSSEDLVAMAGIGIVTAIWAAHGTATLAGWLLATGTAAALVTSRRLASRSSRAAAMAVPLFASWLPLRASPWLVRLDIAVVAGLLGLALATSRTGAPHLLRVADLCGHVPVRMSRQVCDVVGFVRRGAAMVDDRRRDRASGVLAGLAVATPLVVVLALLLASGDRAFAAFLHDAGGSVAPRWLAWWMIGATTGATMIRVAAGADSGPRPAPTPVLGPVESVTVLGSVLVLHGTYAAVQVLGSIRPPAAALQGPHATMEWAHDGFFPLLWASAITLAALVLLDSHGRRGSARQRRVFRSGSVGVVVLTLVMVGVAIHRIVAYAAAYGLTMLRLFCLVFAVWIALVFVLFAAYAAGIGAGVRWFPSAAVIVGLVLSFGLNAADPEARVAAHQVARGARIDVDYVRSLSDDAVPVLVDALDRLDAGSADRLQRSLCGPRARSGSGLGWNRSHARATRALASRCDPAGEG